MYCNFRKRVKSGCRLLSRSSDLPPNRSSAGRFSPDTAAVSAEAGRRTGAGTRCRSTEKPGARTQTERVLHAADRQRHDRSHGPLSHTAHVSPRSGSADRCRVDRCGCFCRRQIGGHSEDSSRSSRGRQQRSQDAHGELHPVGRIQERSDADAAAAQARGGGRPVFFRCRSFRRRSVKNEKGPTGRSPIGLFLLTPRSAGFSGRLPHMESGPFLTRTAVSLSWPHLQAAVLVSHASRPGISLRAGLSLTGRLPQAGCQ